MRTYIKITAYMSGPSILEQIKEYADAGKVDEDTRFFFSQGNSITPGLVASLIHNFDIDIDWDFSKDNVVLIPKDHFLEALNNGGYLSDF